LPFDTTSNRLHTQIHNKHTRVIQVQKLKCTVLC